MSKASNDMTSSWRELGGKRLRRARQSARGGNGYTLREVHEALPKYSVSRLHSYEAGHRGMTPDVAHQLGSFLGVSAAHLLCVDDSGERLDQEAAFLLAKWRSAPALIRSIVTDILTRHA